MENTQDLVIRYLNDAWAAEKEHQKLLQDALDCVGESQVLSLIRGEMESSHVQEEALEACIRGRGKEPSAHKSILSRTIEMLATRRHGENEFDAATLALEQQFGAASLKVGMYRTLESYASLGNLPDVARLARTHIAHELEAIGRAWLLMPQVAAETVHQSRDTQAQETASGEGMPQSPEAPPDTHPWMSRMDGIPIDGGPLTFTPPDPIDDGNGRHVHVQVMMGDGEVCVRDVMTMAVGVIAPEASAQEAAHMMRDLDVGSLPVCEGQRVIGMITDRDLAMRVVDMGRDSRHTTVREAMTPEVFCASENDPVAVAAQVMKEMQVRRLPVVDDGRHIVGIVSLADVAVRQGDDQLSADVLRYVSEPGQTTELSLR